MTRPEGQHLFPRRPTVLPRILQRIQIALLVFVGLLVLGTFGFHAAAEGQASWSDAVHMTLITVTTVGYGEVVRIDSFAERLFAGFIAIAGFGTITFLFTSLSVLFLETDLDYTLGRRRMEKRIAKLKRHYIVCGFGRVGHNVAQELQHSGRRFVAIDSDEQALAQQSDHFQNLLHLTGDASDDDLLIAAGIEDAAGVFAVTGDDSKNLMVTLSSKQLNAQARVVARCHDVRNIEKLRKVGADAIVSPDFTGGMRIASSMIRPHVVSFLDEMLRSEQTLRVEEVVLPAGFVPRPLASLDLSDRQFVLLAVRKGGAWHFNPAGDLPVAAGDVLVAMTTPAGRAHLEQVLA
ncbi:MAG: potassium channel protein [Rhodocyclaceae bacterium]|nr:potassium channel protein [Rhodocyclaceae bacterium]